MFGGCQPHAAGRESPANSTKGVAQGKQKGTGPLWEEHGKAPLLGPDGMCLVFEAGFGGCAEEVAAFAEETAAATPRTRS